MTAEVSLWCLHDVTHYLTTKAVWQHITADNVWPPFHKLNNNLHESKQTIKGLTLLGQRKQLACSCKLSVLVDVNVFEKVSDRRLTEHNGKTILHQWVAKTYDCRTTEFWRPWNHQNYKIFSSHTYWPPLLSTRLQGDNHSQTHREITTVRTTSSTLADHHHYQQRGKQAADN